MNRPNPWEPIPYTPLDEPQRLDPEQRMERFRALRDVTGDHPFVRDVAYMYAKGHIVTFEEAIQQIIRRLVEYYGRFEEGYRDMMRYNVQPIVISAEDAAKLQAQNITPPPPANPDPADGDAGG